MNATTKTEFDLSAYVIPWAKFTQPIERATDDEAGQLAMLDAMDMSKAVFQ